MSPRRRQSLRCVLLAACLTLASAMSTRAADGEILLIAGSRSSIAALSRSDVVNIYMGAYRKLPDGGTAHPIDLERDSPVRRAFYRGLLDKSLDEVNAYWARLVFSGRTLPPAESPGVAAMIERVARDSHAIGYLERSQLPRADQAQPGRDIKIIFVLKK